jgi:hypothetical protein
MMIFKTFLRPTTTTPLKGTLRTKELHMGYYWPTIFQDAKNMSKDVIVASRWANPFHLMRCHYKHGW